MDADSHLLLESAADSGGVVVVFVGSASALGSSDGRILDVEKKT